MIEGATTGVIEGRDGRGRFAPGPSPDRGRGKPPACLRLIPDDEMRRIIMATANLPVSIPRGRGRRVVTLYEAHIRRLATAKVHRRATIMHFIRLVQEAAAYKPEPKAARSNHVSSGLQAYLDRLLAPATSGDDEQLDHDTMAFCELLLDMTRRRSHS